MRVRVNSTLMWKYRPSEVLDRMQQMVVAGVYSLEYGAIRAEKVGQGSLATVFRFPDMPGIVFRFSRERRDATRTYHSLCVRGTYGSKHAPKVYATVSDTDAVFISAIEELTFDHPHPTVRDSYDEDSMPESILAAHRRFIDESGIDEGCNHIPVSSLEERELEGIDLDLVDSYTEFLNEVWTTVQMQMDLHGENIMFREDGTPVLTDPCSWRPSV